jgi:deoxyribonuclease-4
MEKVHGAAMQIFTANQRQWRHAGPDSEQIALFKSRRLQCGRPPVAAHGNYLINLAAADQRVLHQSVEAFAEELKRCRDLGIEFLVMHPGSHGGRVIEPGLSGFVKNLDLAIETSGVSGVCVLIENTAGQGNSLGSSFEQIGYILQNSAYSNTLGICYDTAHGFAAGYDIRDEKTYGLTFDSLSQTIGLERLKFFHINDSKREAGSRVDRHEHIGKGKIGLKGFELLLNDPRFKSHPMVLETPKGKDLREDAENLEVLRALLHP